MPLVSMKDMLSHAYDNGYAVGGFDLVSLDFLEAIISAAEARRAPVILSLAESHFEFFDFNLAMAATVAAARRTDVPVAIHLDHGASFESAVRAIRYGCNGVMVDASHLPFEENAKLTREVVEMAHGCGVPVEGELGYVAGVEGEDAVNHPGEIVYTSPEEAKAFVDKTGVDFLAVSVGTVHGRMRGNPDLDLALLEKINRSAGVPLVIHGGTGLSDAQYRGLIARGVVKINYYTALADAAAASIRERAAADASAGYTGLTRGVRAAIRQEVERMLRIFGSEGRAGASLDHCRPWREIEHLIVFNSSEASDTAVEQRLASGRKMLSAIPGVRSAYTGKALKADAAYRYCWLVRFAQAEVVATYRDHPAHVAYADGEFRPIASDRLSIDFELTG